MCFVPIARQLTSLWCIIKLGVLNASTADRHKTHDNCLLEAKSMITQMKHLSMYILIYDQTYLYITGLNKC